MIATIYEATTGRILRIVGNTDPAGQVGAGEAWVWGSANDATQWVDGGEIVPRPLPPAPPVMSAGVVATWAGLPVGATVTAIDPATGLVAGTDTADAGGAVAIALPAGPWRIAVNEVFPARAAKWLVEVSPE